MIFTIDQRLFDLFPSLSVGTLICRVDNTTYGEDILEGVIERLRAGFSYEKPQDHPHIKAWRQSSKDKVTPQTTCVFMPIDIMEGIDGALCHEIMEKIESRPVRDGLGSVIHKDIVNAAHPSTEFRIG